MTFVPKNEKKLRNVITHNVICADQMTELAVFCNVIQLNFVRANFIKANFIKTNKSLRRSKSSVPNRVLLILTKIQLFKSKYIFRIFYVSMHILRSRSGVFFIKSNG